MSDTSENVALLPGWDTRNDFKTGKRYYINHFTKYASLEDPRIKYKRLQAGDSLTYQSYQSSPVRSLSSQPYYHMHQDTNLSSGRPSPIMGRSYSPLMGSNALHYLAQKPHEYPTLETSVAKIKSLFPTVGETHIKALLHKYHYREAVVVSALQVEKHPLTTPGPFSSPITAARHFSPQTIPSAPGSPGRFSFSSAFKNLSPRRTPHSSPKMKLRYLKSVFPVVEETVLLDTLCSSENNVHKATETLMTMGFMKKDSISYKYSLKKNDNDSFTTEKDLKNDSIFISLHDPSPKTKTTEEKAKIKKSLEEKFNEIAERVITLALETAEYDEERAEQFLIATVKEDNTHPPSTEESRVLEIKKTEIGVPDAKDCPALEEEKPFRDSGIWEKTSPDSVEIKSSTVSMNKFEGKTPEPEVQSDSESKSKIVESSTLVIAPPPATPVKEKRCVTETVVSKTGIKLCAKIIPKGPNKSFLGASRCIPKGPTENLSKGPSKKGIFSFKKNISTQSNTKCVHRPECAIF